MKEIIEFLASNTTGALATIDGDRARVRPWELMFEDDGKFWFCTDNTKSVFRQMKENPNVEFCTCVTKCPSIRLSGRVEFEDNIEIKQRILDNWPKLKEVYKYPDNPLFEVFYIEHGCLHLSNDPFSKPRTIEF